jgi:hypothetical protein
MHLVLRGGAKAPREEWRARTVAGVTARVSQRPIGVSRLEPRGIDLRRGNGPGEDAFHKQATGEFPELERIEPEEPQCIEQQESKRFL